MLTCINNVTEKLQNKGLTHENRQYYSSVLSNLENTRQQLSSASNTPLNVEELRERKEEIDYKTLLLEQLQIMKQTQEELESYLKNHEGHSARIIVAALKKFGVDIQVYHKDSIIGNHCMKLAERGDKIIDEICRKMMPFMKDNSHVKYLQDFASQMQEMLRLWFRIQKVMKSVDLQSDETIMQFERDMDQLRKCILRFIETES